MNTATVTRYRVRGQGSDKSPQGEEIGVIVIDIQEEVTRMRGLNWDGEEKWIRESTGSNS